jgi:DsbC/DsbD-like thiol-disulfide interchange protein
MRWFSLTIFLVVAPAAVPAHGASSNWLEAEGGRVRLVTTGLPDAQGRLKGALQIDLAPGWKTYWRDPGDAGVPPALDLSASSNLSDATFSFPAPVRFEDVGSTSNGYKAPVALPVTLSLQDRTGPLTASAFVGICESICIPVQGELTLDPAEGAHDEADASVVAAAQDALPAKARPEFGVQLVEATADSITVAASFPGDTGTVDIFFAGENGFVFGVPEKRVTDHAVLFTVPILDRPATTQADTGLAYTLTTAAGAVEGLLAIP